RAFADGAELHIAVELLRWVVFDEAVAAVELHGLVADAHGYFAGVELGHAGFAGDALARVLEHGGALGEQAGGVEFGGHVGELPLDPLELGDGFAELLPLLYVSERGVERAASNAERESGDGDASAVEDAHGIDEAFAKRAEQIFAGNFAVLEDEFRGVAGAESELVFLLAGTEAWSGFLDNEG